MPSEFVSINKIREVHLDWICGLLILRMMISHIAINTGLSENSYIIIFRYLFSFIMPWFFFKSGMVFRPSSDYRLFFKKSFKRLLVPFLFWGIVGLLVSVTIFKLLNQTIPNQYISIYNWVNSGYLGEGNGPLWFLFTLFCVRIIYNYLQTISFPVPTLFIAVVAILCSAELHYSGILWKVFTPHILQGLFYFICGHELAKWQYTRTAVIFTACTFLSLMYWRGFSYVDMFANNLIYGSYLINPIYCLCAIIIINNLIKWLPDVFFSILPLQFVGRHSMVYYVSHFPLIHILCAICYYVLDIENNIVVFWIIVGGLLVILPCIDYVFHKPCLIWTLGEKNKTNQNHEK